MGSVQQAQEVFSFQAEEHHEGEEDTDSAGVELTVLNAVTVVSWVGNSFRVS